MDRTRAHFEERCTWLGCSEMGVMVIKDCNISRKSTRHLHAITSFIREEIFRFELTTPENRYYNRKRSWVLRNSWGDNRRI